MAEFSNASNSPDFTACLKSRAEEAARTGDARTLRICFSQGLKMPPTGDDNPALVYAANDGASQAVYDVLLENGWDINQYLELEGSALAVACFHANAPLVKYLLSKGADPNSKHTFENHTTLIWAVMSDQPGATETLEAMLTHGPRKARTIGTGAVLAAVEKGSLETLKLVVERGDGGINEAVEYADSHDEVTMPLYEAVISGNVEIVECLLAKGADATWKDRDGKTARDVAVEHGSHAIVALIRD